MNCRDNRIGIWAAPPRALLAARSCLQILDDKDRAELGEITAAPQRDIATAARVLLRLALSHAAHHAVAAGEWRFCRSANSKPRIASSLPELQFSVAHCPSAVVVAVSAGLQVGIDVESIDQTMSGGMVDTYLSQAERSDLARLHSAQRARESLRLWTLKEAFAKLTGAGLSSDFASIEFSLAPTRLRHRQQDDASRSTHFETLHFSAGGDLCLISLAAGATQPESLRGEIQLTNLSDDEGAARAMLVPVISL